MKASPAHLQTKKIPPDREVDASSLTQSMTTGLGQPLEGFCAVNHALT